ncbi:hypothetical protein F5883DRAFT_428012 [Diaporthe sp. PMI_573]|nr:hypothetical protein F5883DRAFT_428012 [Diaporthaceae sp. PMI_573]
MLRCKGHLKQCGHHGVVCIVWSCGARLMARATTAAKASRPFPAPDSEWNTKEKLISTARSGGFRAENVEVVVEQTKFERGSGDGIVEALSTPFWNPLHDGSTEATTKWQDALRQQLTPEQEEGGAVDMIAWVCVAQKEF